MRVLKMEILDSGPVAMRIIAMREPKPQLIRATVTFAKPTAKGGR